MNKPNPRLILANLKNATSAFQGYLSFVNRLIIPETEFYSQLGETGPNTDFVLPHIIDLVQQNAKSDPATDEQF